MARFAIIWADGIGTAKLDPRDADSVLLDVVLELTTDLAERGHQSFDYKVPWKASMATIGGSTSWHNAAHGGVLAIDDLVLGLHVDTQVILLGYSGGCKVIHDWLDSRPQHLWRVAAVGYVSDPFRPPNRFQSGTPNPGGYGICGSKLGPLPAKTFWTSFADDVISSCPEDSPLRTPADLSDKIPGSLLDDLGEHLRLGDFQLANYIKLWRRDPLAYLVGLPGRMRVARQGVMNYLGSAHTLAYTRPFVSHIKPEDDRPLTMRLAATIAYKVR